MCRKKEGMVLTTPCLKCVGQSLGLHCIRQTAILWNVAPGGAWVRWEIEMMFSKVGWEECV